MSSNTALSALLTSWLAVLALAAPVYAQVSDEAPDDGVSDDGEVLELDQISVIANKSARPLRDVVGTVTVISRDRMDKKMMRSVADLVRYEPDISTAYDSSRFGLNGFNIRGVDGNRVATELDGVPIADGFSIGSFSNATRNYVDPEVLKRVEILRGPASTLYGSDAIGGVVTFTTKDPNDYLLDQDDFHFGLKTGYSGADNGAMVTTTIAGAGENVSSLLVWSRREAHEQKNNSGSQFDANPQDVSDENILAKLLFSTAADNVIRLTADYSSNTVKTDVNSLAPGPGRFASNTLLKGDDSLDRLRLSVDYEFASNLAWLDGGILRIYSQDSEIDQKTIEERAASARAPSPTRRNRRFKYDTDLIGGEATLEKAIYAESATHRFVFGGETTISDITEIRHGLMTNLDDGSTTNIIIGEEFPVRDFPDSQTIEFGMYFQDEISFANNRFTLIPGIRYEYYDMDPDDDAIFREDNPDTMVYGLSEDNWSPKLGVLFNASDNLSLFAQYARGFRSPPFDDVNIGFTIPAFGFEAIPNPDLRPETSDGIELGTRYNGDYSFFSASAWYNDYEDLIESRVNLGVDPDTGLLTFQSLNRAEASIYGADLRYRVDLAGLSPMLDGFTMRANLAWARGDDDDRDEPLNTVDPAKAVLGLDYDHSNGRWGASLMLTGVASKDRVDDSMGPVFEPDGYGVVDVFGFLRLGERSRLNWGVFNLSDKKYWVWSDVRSMPAGDPLLPYHTRPGRNVSVSLSFNL